MIAEMFLVLVFFFIAVVVMSIIEFFVRKM